MFWLTFIACIPLVVLLAVMVIGRFLPRKHIVTRRGQYRASPEALWEAMTDHREMNQWRSDISRVLRAKGKGDLPAWQEVGRFTKRAVKVTTSRPPYRLNAEIINGVVPMRGHMRFHIKPSGGGALLTITEEAEIPSPLFRFAARYLIGLHSPLDLRLVALGRHFRERVRPEDGEPV
jgi:hypothetical protein